MAFIWSLILHLASCTVRTDKVALTVHLEGQAIQRNCGLNVGFAYF